MRATEGELYEDWCNRARMFELGVAMQRIACGESADAVLEEMSQRLLNKLMHHLHELALTEVEINFDKEKSKLEYKENYLNKVNPAADHVQQEE